MARKGYEPEWRKNKRLLPTWLAARREAKRRKRQERVERKRLEELRVEAEALKELRVEVEAAKNVAKKLVAQRTAQLRAAVDAFQREKEAKKRAAREKEFKKWLNVFVQSVREDSMVVDALIEALARRTLTMQSKRRKVMLTEEVTEVSLSPILCPIPKAATLIGRGVSFIYDAIATGKIKAEKSDKRTWVLEKSLHAYVSPLDDAVIKPRQKRAHPRRKKTPHPSTPPQKRAVSPSL